MASMALGPNTSSMFGLGIKDMRTANNTPRPSLSGQTCLITGSNSGIGLACAKILPTLGITHLIMAVRTIAKGEAAAAPLRHAHPKVKIDVWDLDMSSYPSIERFAQRCAELPRLDSAILNAGTGSSAVSKINASTGYEETIQVNYLSTALLAILLLPTLAPKTPSSPPGRLTIVGSATGLFATFANRNAVPLLPSFNIPFSGNVAAMERYGTSKMLVMMLVHSLSQHISAERVIINTVEPGLTSGTDLHRDFSSGGRAFFGLMKKMSAKTPEQAAYTYLDAVAIKGKESHGGYLMFWQVWGFPKLMHTDEGKTTMQRLWDETMVELGFAGVKQILESIK